MDQYGCGFSRIFNTFLDVPLYNMFIFPVTVIPLGCNGVQWYNVALFVWIVIWN